MADSNTFFINRPTAKAFEAAYKPQPPPSNPVLRGLPLSVLASVVASSGFLQRILWSNAGFGSLRDKAELEDIDPRYEPNVIKSTGVASIDGNHLSVLSSEDWISKQPSEKVFRSAIDYHEAYKAKVVTPLQVVETLLPLIRRDVEGAKHSVAFLSTKVALVRKAAEESTARYAAGKFLSVLDGVPTAVKDEEDLAGYTKSSGSKLDFTHKDNATSFCVQQWLDAGAICVGKTTMHELGMDTTNCNPNFGTPRNPNNAHYYCGGSSGGSAYAVAAGLVPFAMGNDGGGSVRIPSAYCGLYGLKTSHGRVSCRPSSNLAASNGVAGPIAANMIDLELAYRVMAQPDALHGDSSLFAMPGPVAKVEPKQTKVLGVFRPWVDRADEAVKKSFDMALDHLTAELGYEVVDITIPLVHEGQLAHAMTILAEIASGLPSVASLTAPNKVLICVGKQSSAVDLLQAQKLRHLLMQHLAYLFDKHPGLIVMAPTTPNAGWHINEADLKYGCSDGNMSIRNMEYVWLANFTGCPSISVPVGWADPVEGDGKVPVGLMGMSEWGGEDLLMELGYDLEAWVHKDPKAGRPRPGNWMDILELAEKQT